MSNPAYNYRFGNNDRWPMRIDATSYDLEPEQRWMLVVYPVGREVESLRIECMRAAQQFSEEALAEDKDMLIHLSGGDDSTAMVHCFMKQDLPFTCHTRIHKIKGRIANEEDVQVSMDFCAHHGIKLDILTLDDLDEEWGRTEELFFLDMTALSARLGYRANADKYNLQATAPYIMTGGAVWDLLPTFSMGPNFLHSFFFGNPAVFYALLDHPAMEVSMPAMKTLANTAALLPGAHRELLHDVFAYEKIVKPMVMHDAFPELRDRGRVKNTGFEDADPNMNTSVPPWNEAYHKMLRKKIFRVPVHEVLRAMQGHAPTAFWKEGDKVVKWPLAQNYV